MIAVFKRELVGFFKNSTAYLLLSIYAFLSALFFCLFVMLNNTSYLGNFFGLWLFVVEIIIVSILSMRFFSEEKKNKTDQLIFTSPVSLSSVVMGKFLGGMTVYTACTMINLIYVLVIDIFGKTDGGTNFANFVGTLLLGSCMIAIALFVSSLTENSIVAAGGTAGVFLLLMMVDFVSSFLFALLPQWMHWLPEFFRKMNIFLWYDNFAGGIVTLESVVFYLSLTAIFLFLTVRVLERRRWR
ncbi:MAG: ABC transporter permease subunit [Clostridia bacterium]|nr:ABC transporter permease subunit [Clostridia bacterium]